ncbi:MAG: zinc-ribbon domain-containing protein [Lachnospiraceae bacterium]|nr:zinc-ribbon domain-containing protein [Lachnospiraceae bacterium]
MKEKLRRFMYGRYGTDQLNRTLMIVSLLIWVISIFTSNLLYIMSVTGLILVYLRMFSKNIPQRRKENFIYLTYENKIKYFWRQKKAEIQQLKTHHIFKCPSCRQKIRIPRNNSPQKRKIEITCPKCRQTFIKNC